MAILLLAGCGRGNRDKEAVRQGVVDHLAKAGLNVSAMNVTLTSVDFKGQQADANVEVSPRGGQGKVTLTYKLEQQDNKWVVVGRPGGTPHGGGMPGGANPHQGMPEGTPPPQGGAMPSPHDLPPVKK